VQNTPLIPQGNRLKPNWIDSGTGSRGETRGIYTTLQDAKLNITHN